MGKVSETVSKPVSRPSAMMDGPPLFCNLVPVKSLLLLVRTLERDKYIFLNIEKHTNTQAGSYKASPQ